MSHAPKLTGAGRVIGMSETHIEIDRASIPSTEWHQGYYDLLYVAGGVRITIEPAEEPSEDAPAPGDALDYLAELKGVLTALVLEHAAAPAEMRERVLRRALNLANTSSNAVLAERRAAR